ncbi:MAG: MBL fold metallo-hydrolase [Planctomycetota bacterium]|jgi:glyoxylase-like metal-dependent hydrolase (beta-lactamase superfamily II)/rhodanese-related sulfurtransferase
MISLERIIPWLFFLIVPLLAISALRAHNLPQEIKLKDAESATHGFEGAVHQVVDTYEYPGFEVVQINLAVLSHYSYMLISSGESLVVDPDRDIDFYLETAKREGAPVKGVILTHSHADFVAGHIELAATLGVPIYQNAASGAEYKIESMREGSKVEFGEALLEFIETPGHTPDSMCVKVFGKAHRDSPAILITGDTLFVGSVGRPDLMGGQVAPATLASMLFDTWTNKLSKLKDDVVVFPAHGAGSLCGAHLSDKPFSTIGTERTSNSYLQHRTRSTFIAAVLEGLPEAPQYFKHNAAMNRKGPEKVAWDAPLPPEIKPDPSLSDPALYYVVDLRDAAEYAACHIPNAVNIGVRGRLEAWLGIMVPWDARLVLCGTAAELEESVRRLHRVGYKPVGVINVETCEKAKALLSTMKSDPIKPRELYDLMQKGEDPLIVDVRLPNEWMGVRIGTVINIPLNHLFEQSSGLDPTQPVVTVCNSAYRSSMAIGILERKGFKNIRSMEGGGEAWINAGLPVYGAETQGAAFARGPAVPKREIRLAERISAVELKRLIMDLPGTFDLVDIRPAVQYGDYSLPGSSNVDIADLLNNPAYLTGAGPLIVADRDGSLAMMVAGILSQKTQRPIKALYGGLEAYWRESEMAGVAAGGESPGIGASQPPARPVRPSTPAGTSPPAPTQKPKTPKKKSAGC